MAKKAGTKRVHQIAKELGVASKDVVNKCISEGIPSVSNHMSTLSAGLAATIREWFNEGGESGSAVQVAAPVDVTKARAKAKKKVRKKSPSKAKQKDEDKAPDPQEELPADPPDTVPEEKAPELPVEEPSEEEVPTAKEKPEPPADPPAAETDPVQRGRKLKQPVKTKLAGPKVIRVETPDVVPKPRTARGTKPDAGKPAPAQGGPPMPRTPGEPPAGEGRRTSRRNKRRSASAKQETGRTGASSRPQQQDKGQSNWRKQDLLERERRLSRAGGFFKAARRDSQKRVSGTGGRRAQSAFERGGPITLPEPITIKAISSESGIKANEILKQFLLEEHEVDINSVLDSDLAVEMMEILGIELTIVEQVSAEAEIAKGFEDREMHDEQSRSPVVTILGHVDHGKTSLLDCIRNAKVADGEAGGITQATSAFRVPVEIGDETREITFIDTPGHEAFTEMRSRGAKATDIVVLVVAADDGVMPQTIESINHAKDAEVPIVVALNKIDKAEATDPNIQRILGQLAEHELNPTEWGGDIEIVRTSAAEQTGISDLLEILDYQAQLLDLKADFDGPAEGVVLESRIEDGRGPVANLLVQQGRLNKGDCIVVGRGYGRVRDIVNDRGDRNDAGLPSTPVTISGMNVVPDAGDKFYVVKNLRKAESAAEERIQAERERDLATEKVTLDNIFEKLEGASKKELPIIVKADCQGSVETLKASLEKCTTDDVTVVVKHTAVGGVNDSDISLAEASGAIIVGFNVTAAGSVRKGAESHGVDIRFYDVIYDITNDVEKAILGLLDPIQRLEILGHAEVREVFKISKVGMIAGCYVTEGTIERNALVRVTRDEIVIENDRKLSQLKRFKDDAKEVKSGQECGMKIDGYDDIKVGDVLECYKVHHVQPGT
ncbi:MAG: translation initiation factor IF-2 [Planctomycetota bacterium]|nr:translation initiation factor IF-2 [Planctomycetota bacterium]